MFCAAHTSRTDDVSANNQNPGPTLDEIQGAARDPETMNELFHTSEENIHQVSESTSDQSDLDDFSDHDVDSSCSESLDEVTKRTN